MNVSQSMEARVIPVDFDKMKRYQEIPVATEDEINDMVTGIKLGEEEVSRIKEILLHSQAILKGHFELRSGGHSSYFLQFARIAQRFEHINYIAKLILARFYNDRIDTILSPNRAGTLLGIRLAYLLQCRFIQCTLIKGNAELRPGLEIDTGENILAINDIATTGSGLNGLKELGEKGNLVGIATLACRYRDGYEKLKEVFQPVRYEALIELKMDLYNKHEKCPLCEKQMPLIQASDLFG